MKQKEANDAILDFPGYGKNATFKCPYDNCGAVSQHDWGIAQLVAFKPTSNASFIGRNVSPDTVVMLALCQACEQEVVFVNGQLSYPEENSAPRPHDDMPEAVRALFDEAATIFDKSPRGASALLRVALETLLPDLGAKKKGLNDAIGELVKLGKAPPDVQRALDTIRILGNEAAHPGTINLSDDSETAFKLFSLINLIVDRAIGEPKRISALYGALPPEKLEHVVRRDMSGSS